MKASRQARRLSFVILAATMSFAAVAGAQDEEPSATDESGPPDYPPPGPPQAEAAPAGPAAPGPGPAAAPELGLGALGQIAISDDMQVAIIRQTLSAQGQTVDVTQIQLQPAIDYFVSPNLSIGGQVQIAYRSSDNGFGSTSDETTVGLVPRIGYNVPLGVSSSIWPRVGLGYIHTSTNDGSGSPGFSSYTVTLQVFVPLIFQPVPHFFVGGGPLVATDLISKREDQDGIKTTNIGLLSTIGGYFGGP